MSSVLDDINKKRKTLLKDKEASEIGLIKGLVVDNFDEARKKGSQYRDAKGELQDGFLGYKVNKKTGEEEVEPKATPIVGESAEKWHAKMADARERWDNLAARIGSNNTLYGVKVAEDDRRLPESVAYLDGTMPKKQQTPAAQSRYDKVIADIEAAKSPSRLKRHHIREMNEERGGYPYYYREDVPHVAGRENWSAEELRKLIEDSKKRKETEPQKPQAPAVKEEPFAIWEAAKKLIEEGKIRIEAEPQKPQTPAVKEEVSVVKKEVPAVTPAKEKSAATEQKQMTYTDLLNTIDPGMTPEEKAEQQRRQRNRQIINAVGDGISALANLYYTNKSGVNAYDPSTSLTKAAKERYDKLLAQQREDENRRKELAYRSGVADIEAAYKRARDAKADEIAEDEMAYKRERDAKADALADAAAQAAGRKEQREIEESNARIAKDKALENLYNTRADDYKNGGKNSGTSGSGSTGSKDSILLINDDGTKTTYRKADSVDYIHAAYAALPNEYKIQAKDSIGRLLFDDNGNPVYDDNVNPQQMLNVIARYNARKRPTAKTSSNKNGKKQNPMSSGKKQNPMN